MTQSNEDRYVQNIKRRVRVLQDKYDMPSISDSRMNKLVKAVRNLHGEGVNDMDLHTLVRLVLRGLLGD